MSPILGIDLGTHHARAAVLDPDGVARVVPNSDGHDLSPAVLHLHEEDGAITGEEAWKMQALDPKHVVVGPAAHLGDATFKHRAFGRDWSAQELCGLLLDRLRRDAEELRGEPITDAVLIVPASADAAQRRAYAEAGILGGLKVRSVVNAPTAAALAGHTLDAHEGTHIVVDLGGAHVEISAIERSARRLTTLGAHADVGVGGGDLETAILGWAADLHRSEHGADPRRDPTNLQALLGAARFALRSLTVREHVMVPVGRGAKRSSHRLDRRTLEHIARDPVMRIERSLSFGLRKLGVPPNAVRSVMVVGGAAHTIALQQLIDGLLPCPTRVLPHPEHAIARGAARAAAMRHVPKHPGLRARPKPTAATPERPVASPQPPQPSRGAALGLADGGHHDDVELREQTTQSLGIIALDGARREQVVELIPAGTPLPTRHIARFAYAYDGMTAVRIEVTEGSGTTRQDVHVVGTVELEGLPPRPKGTPIEVRYHYDLDQTLRVEVLDVSTGRTREARLHFRGSLAPDALAAARQSAQRMQVE